MEEEEEEGELLWGLRGLDAGGTAGGVLTLSAGVLTAGSGLLFTAGAGLTGAVVGCCGSQTNICIYSIFPLIVLTRN